MAGRNQNTDAVVTGVGDVQVARGIHGDAAGNVQLGASGRPVVAAEAAAARGARQTASRHGGDHPIRDDADAVVTTVGDVQVPGGIHGDARGTVQLGVAGRAVIAAEAWRSVSRDGSHHPIRDLADTVIPRVGDVQVARGIHGDAPRTAQLGAGGWAVVAAVAVRPIPRHGGDHPVRHLADPTAALVGDVQVVGGIHSDAVGPG